MITACANPACNRPFHYLRGGRLYRFDLRSPQFRGGGVRNAISGGGHDRTTLFFWLCKQCSASFALRFESDTGITVVPLARRREVRQRGPVVIVHEPTGEVKQVQSPRLPSAPLLLYSVRTRPF